MGIANRAAVRYGLAFIGGLPVAGLLAGDAGLFSNGLPGRSSIILGAFIVGLIVATIWAALAPEPRQTFRRSCLLFMMASILLPVVALVFALTEPTPSNPIFTRAFAFLLLLTGGTALAFVSWLLAHYVPLLGEVKFWVVTGTLATIIVAIAIWILYTFVKY